VRERLPAVLGVMRMRSLYGSIDLSQLDPEAGWVERRVALQTRSALPQLRVQPGQQRRRGGDNSLNDSDAEDELQMQRAMSRASEVHTGRPWF
jgi:hypothetical protein